MNKRNQFIASAMLAVSLLTGCSSNTESSAKSVSTDGSTSMEKVIGTLGESFMNEQADVKFTYNPTGSGSGIQAVLDGRCDIGLSSRALKEDEKAKGLTETVLCLDGISVVVHPENSVEDLTLDQLASIYKGEIKNWSEVGGKDGEIVLIGREAGSGTRDGFESITDTKDKCDYDQELTSTGDVITTVSGNPNAIGYASMASVKGSVKAITVDGIEATEENVQLGTYPIQRPFVMVTNEAKALSESAQAFFDYCLSDNVKELIRQAGAVPLA